MMTFVTWRKGRQAENNHITEITWKVDRIKGRKSRHRYDRYNSTTGKPQPFYGPLSGTTHVSRCQKITSGLYDTRED